MKPLDRRKARYIAIQVIYIHELLGEKIEKIFEKIKNLNKFREDIMEYAKKIIKEYEKNSYSIDREIKNHLKGWRWEQVGYVEKAILKVGTTEMLYIEDISPLVAVNEAVELAKGLGTDAAGSFVNGILGAIYEEKIKV